MNAQNYTQKSLEAIQAAQKLTIENQNQQIEQIHLLAALLKQENGLVPQLLKKMGVTLESFEAAVLFWNVGRWAELRYRLERPRESMKHWNCVMEIRKDMVARG